MKNTHQIFLISDSTGETLDRIFMALKAYCAIIHNTFSNRYYEKNFSTKQLKKKKNPWFSCENVNQGWKSCFIQQKKKGQKGSQRLVCLIPIKSLPLMSVCIPVSFLGYFISDQKIVGLRYRSRKSFLGLRSKEIK